MTYNNLSELAIGNRHYILKVRITRIWDSINPFADNNQVMSVDFLAVDEQGTCIQGTMRIANSIQIKRMLLEGHVYELANFCVIPARRTFRAAFGDRFVQLTNTTKINELTELIDSIPTYVFNCFEYSELPRRAYNDEYLTDVIGVLKKIGRIGTAYIREKPIDKRNLIIQNESGALLHATIWGDHAKEQNHNEMLAKTGPVVLILSAMTVRHFRGEICVNSTSAFRSYTNLPISQVEDFINKLSPGDYNVELLPEAQQPIKPD